MNNGHVSNRGLMSGSTAGASYSASSDSSNSPPATVGSFPPPTHFVANGISYQIVQPSLNPPFSQTPHQYSFGPHDMPYATNAPFDPIIPPFTSPMYDSFSRQQPLVSPIASAPTSLTFDTAISASTSASGTGHELIHSSYPAQLPPPPLLDHLLELFFEKVPFGDRLVHRPSFMASLRYPPNSPPYPSSSLLHAMCAISSVYSPIIEQHVRVSRDEPHRSWFEYFTHADEIDLEAGGAGNGLGGSEDGGVSPAAKAAKRRDVFGVEQASIGRVLALFDLRTGKRVLDTVRSMICLIWYYVGTPFVSYWHFFDLSFSRTIVLLPVF